MNKKIDNKKLLNVQRETFTGHQYFINSRKLYINYLVYELFSQLCYKLLIFRGYSFDNFALVVFIC